MIKQVLQFSVWVVCFSLGGCASMSAVGNKPSILLLDVDLATSKRIVVGAMERHGWTSMGGNLYSAKFTGGNIGRISLMHPEKPNYKFRKPPHVLFRLAKSGPNTRVTASYYEENRNLTNDYFSELERLLEMISREKALGEKLRLDRFPIDEELERRLEQGGP